MPHPDQAFLADTTRDERTLACPLCPHTIDVPPVRASDQLGAIFGMSSEDLARMNAKHLATLAAEEMRRHLGEHSVDEWVAEVAGLRRLTEAAIVKATQ